jgi:glycyl-tRNA synthetase beta chain
LISEKRRKNSKMSDFLLEIGLDEIPARMIAKAEQDLSLCVKNLLTRERLLTVKGSTLWEDGTRFENGVPVPAGYTVNGEYVIKSYSTPRRLAVYVRDVKLKQDDTKELLVGPSWKVAFKDGVPTAAAEAFAKKASVAVGDLQKTVNAKGEYVSAHVERPGRTAADVLVAELPKEVLSLYWPKNMYWRAGKPERFVRPVRWVVALLDAAVVPLEIAGIKAGNTSRGHRILHGEAPVVIDSPKNYSKNLLAASVVVEVGERRKSIRKALDAATRTVAGARWREDEPLIETVVHLTEWPSVVLGDFEPEYLALPEEVLVTVMRDHQKYFAVEDANGKLAPNFLAVLNTAVDDKGREIIRHGNARVLTARFKDARFFWDFDQKKPLADRVESLKNVTFQKELGSYHWKTEANHAVAKLLSERLLAVTQGPPQDLPDWNALSTAVKLSKTDLTTELVKEFTELQGVIGGLYAEWQGLTKTVATAIKEQYTPASTEDAIPTTGEGQLLGLADRIQTITAMFSIGNAPTGSKDPFALRRAANAVVKILAESGLPLTLDDVVRASVIAVSKENQANQDQVAAFLRERLSFYLKDVRGFPYDVVNAVLAAEADDVRDTIARCEALTAARESADFAAISAAFKRIKNILRQAGEKQFSLGSPKDVKLASEAQQLADAATALAPEVAKLREQRAYGEALTAIATLRPVVDTFFEKVMVLDPDPAVRGANLGLIDEVLRRFSDIADFSEIVTG